MEDLRFSCNFGRKSECDWFPHQKTKRQSQATAETNNMKHFSKSLLGRLLCCSHARGLSTAHDPLGKSLDRQSVSITINGLSTSGSEHCGSLLDEQGESHPNLKA